MPEVGQYFGSTSGTNDGLAVLNLEFSNPLAGRVMFADNDLQKPALSAAIKFNKFDDEVDADLFDFEFFNYTTLQFEHSKLINLRPNVEKVVSEGKITGVLRGNIITGLWSTNRDTNGKFSVEKGNIHEKRNPDRRIYTWNIFKKYISTIDTERGNNIYRGQRDLEWNLCASFYRNGRNDLLRYSRSDVPMLAHHINAVSSYKYDLNKMDEFGALINLGQHHGYPTPLLDWTESPYVAAFFAYESIPKHVKKGKVRIYIFNQSEWRKRTYQSISIIDPRPTVTVSVLPAINNNRAIPQQSVYTFSNMEDTERFIRYYEHVLNFRFLTVIDLPVGIRNEVLEDLRYMGITAGSLFPGFDGVCKSLKERYFTPFII